ncbi:hypothetical protein [Asticcacaulis sp. EMRT-3]|uniref:DUF7662 domain-containing protein n=1 Tax=Asticcacaulis sp. EMRT-3 TaxID=3040349 RepID=UPI0024AF1651|nr:hypothetical protein [Asticcacaulis sp. EMRT-3]MDI7775035.1 hypothetical protein [Asticcacaulis sp. EMRT-3]
MAAMSKYDPLEDYLKQTDDEQVLMGFSEIENVLGFELPPSSRRQRAWWSNNPSNNVMTRAWLEAGYETEAVDMAAGRLTFRKMKKTMPKSETLKTSGSQPRRHPAFGALKGLMTLPSDLDLTQPAYPEWADSLPEQG